MDIRESKGISRDNYKQYKELFKNLNKKIKQLEGVPK